MLSKRDNYAIMAQQCRDRFKTYDQAAILRSIPLDRHDENFLYLTVLGQQCRIHRHTGAIYRSDAESVPSGCHDDTFTIFDYLCDAAPNRRAAGTFVSMASLGGHTHTRLLESDSADPLAAAIDRDPGAFVRACTQMGGVPCPGGDLAFQLFLFPDLPLQLRFWHSDPEFAPQLQFFWDAQVLSFLRYETTYYAAGMVRSRLAQRMKAAPDL